MSVHPGDSETKRTSAPVSSGHQGAARPARAPAPGQLRLPLPRLFSLLLTPFTAHQFASPPSSQTTNSDVTSSKKASRVPSLWGQKPGSLWSVPGLLGDFWASEDSPEKQGQGQGCPRHRLRSPPSLQPAGANPGLPPAPGVSTDGPSVNSRGGRSVSRPKQVCAPETRSRPAGGGGSGCQD